MVDVQTTSASSLLTFGREHALGIGAYTLACTTTFVLQGALLPRLAANSPTARTVWLLGGTFVGIGLVELLTSHAYAYLAPRLEEHLTKSAVRSGVLGRTGPVDESTVVSQVTVAVDTLCTIGNFCARFVLRTVLGVLVLLVSTFQYSRRVALLLLLGVAVLAAGLWPCATRVARSTTREHTERSRTARALGELAGNWEQVQAVGASEERFALYSRACERRTSRYRATCERMRDFVAVVVVGSAVVFTSALALALREVRLGRMSDVKYRTLVNSLVVYFGVFAAFAQQLAALAYNVGQHLAFRPAAREETTPEPSQPTPQPAAAGWGGAALAFVGARARFGQLEPFTFTLREQERVWFVAPSGSGKTALLRAAALGEELAEGSVFVAPGATYVPQECALFEGTLFENLSVGHPTLARDDPLLGRAARLLVCFPQGLDTRTGPHGRTWSAGQRKITVVLRALLRPYEGGPFLADEPFASLDAEAARLLAELLELATRHRAAAVVSHSAYDLLPFRRVVLPCPTGPEQAWAD
jgi:ATP-binding cassette subfamily B protein